MKMFLAMFEDEEDLINGEQFLFYARLLTQQIK